MPLYVCVEERIRLTASALLLTRFCNEQSRYKWHPLKTRVLAHVTPLRDHPFIELINRLSAQWWMHPFYSIAVLLEPYESGFRIPEGLAQQIPELRAERYNELLWQFYQDSQVDKLWEDTSDLWEQVTADCTNLLAQGKVEEFLFTVYGPAPRRLTVVPNPLDPASFGFAPSNAESFFSVVGPPAIPHSDSREVRYIEWGTRLTGVVVHEFSHSLLASARGKCPNLIESTKHLAERISPRGYFAKMYDNWEIQFDEMFIRAVEALYLLETEGISAADRKLAQEESEYGIPLIRPIFGSLNSYLTERRQGTYSGLADFLPELAGQMANW